MNHATLTGAFLRLIRWPNLLMIILTMIAMRYGIIYPILDMNGLMFKLPFLYFAGLMLACVLLAAAGYIINDYFDVNSDLINKPGKVIIDKLIKRKVAIILHFVFNALAILITAYISYKIGQLFYTLVFFIISGLLWFYSTTYKKQLLMGNIIVSFIAGLLPIIVLIYDIPLLNAFYNDGSDIRVSFSFIIYLVLAFSFFAFITTFIRELIKDIEDIEGDKSYGSQSFAVVYGVEKSKLLAYALLLLTVVALFVTFFLYLNPQFEKKASVLSISYIVLFIAIPLIYVTMTLYKANKVKDYTLASKLMKIIMLMGTLYAFLFYIIVQNIQ